jgi:glutamyl-tRNA reductase
VACGLEAAILGESQVLSQVAAALRHGIAAHSVDPLLKDVFRTAVRSAERARRTVWAAYRAADIGMAAASGAAEALHGLAGASAVVVGAGDVAELTVNALRARGVGRLTVVNRSTDGAESLAMRHGVQTAALDQLATTVREADLVVVATRAPLPVLGVDLVRAALASRPDRALAIVDTALPRNVDPGVRSLTGVTLLDLDDLRPQFARASHERLSGVAAVEALIEQEVSALLARRACRSREPRNVGRATPAHAMPLPQRALA